MRARTLLSVLVAICFSALVGCNSWGTKIQFGKSDVFYTSTANEADAKKMGEYMQKIGLFKDPVTVQLNKADKTYQVRIAVQKQLHGDQEMADSLALIGGKVSAQCFNGEPVEVHMCDEKMATVKTIPAIPLGKVVVEKDNDLYYTAPVTEADAKAVLAVLVKDKWPGDVQMAKDGDTFKANFAGEKDIEKDAATVAKIQEVTKSISTALKGQKVMPVVTTAHFKKVKELTVEPAAAPSPKPSAEPGDDSGNE